MSCKASLFSRAPPRSPSLAELQWGMHTHFSPQGPGSPPLNSVQGLRGQAESTSRRALLSVIPTPSLLPPVYMYAQRCQSLYAIAYIILLLCSETYLRPQVENGWLKPLPVLHTHLPPVTHSSSWNASLGREGSQGEASHRMRSGCSEAAIELGCRQESMSGDRKGLVMVTLPTVLLSVSSLSDPQPSRPSS